jgi:hypothetical protein
VQPVHSAEEVMSIRAGITKQPQIVKKYKDLPILRDSARFSGSSRNLAT